MVKRIFVVESKKMDFSLYNAVIVPQGRYTSA